ncbi:hypothetical protein [Metabacillus fastidiosus]|uniref:hypothetical protein n=1 Tax=Metabacillus fastidiosus TaxID=1458 RepID=UPI002E1A8C9A|nr:hypothetical protein [Metabacillus fastidiosus]
MKKLLLTIVLVVSFSFTNASLAEDLFITPHFQPSNYKETELLYDLKEWRAEKDSYVTVRHLQLIRTGELNREETTYDRLANKIFLTVRLKIEAKDQPLSYSIPSLTSMSEQTEYGTVKDYTSDFTSIELEPGETEEITLTFLPKPKSSGFENFHVLQLTNYIAEETYKTERIILPISEEGEKIVQEHKQGINPDNIQSKALFQKDPVTQLQIEKEQTSEGIGNFKLHGLEVSLLKESKMHGQTDMVVSNVKPGQLALSFHISVESSSHIKRLFNLKPTLTLNGEKYSVARSFSTPGTFIELTAEDGEITQYLVFVIEESEWRKADHASLSLGPVFALDHREVNQSNVDFLLEWGDR